MALLGFYVGVLPITLGMLWLPFVRRIDPRWLRVLMALTIGLLGVPRDRRDARGHRRRRPGLAGARRHGARVPRRASSSYLVLTAVEAWLQERRAKSASTTSEGGHVAMLVAIAIGLHNLGEGLAIGSAYAVGALALGAFLVIGFALHNTTEGLAIVAPIAARPPSPATARPARADRRSAGDPGRVDRRLGLQLQPGRVPAGRRRRRDRAGDPAARADHPREGRAAWSARSTPPASRASSPASRSSTRRACWSACEGRSRQVVDVPEQRPALRGDPELREGDLRARAARGRDGHQQRARRAARRDAGVGIEHGEEARRAGARHATFPTRA